MSKDSGDKDDILLTDEERIFLVEFPVYKEDIEVTIRKLRAFAGDTEESHKTFTKVSMVSNIVCVVADVMCILGLVFAPATAGGSLILSAAAKCLGAAAGVTSAVTNILEYFHNKEVQARANIQVSKHKQVLRVAKTVVNFGRNTKNCEKTIRAFQIARTNPLLASVAKHLLTAGYVSVQTAKQVQEAFEGTMMVMMGIIRFVSRVMTSVFLSTDWKALVENVKNLKKGKTELAEELRTKAWEMERELTELTELYERLRRKEKWRWYWEGVLQVTVCQERPRKETGSLHFSVFSPPQVKLHAFWPRTHCQLCREKYQGTLRGTMAVAAAENYSDGLHQRIIQCLAELTREEMGWLLGNPQTLDAVMERLPLESDEASVLHHILVQELVRREEEDGPHGHLSRKERMFLLAFPLRKHKLEKTIKELQTTADQADSTDKTLTRARLVANSAGAVSAAMTVLGVALSPVTAGGNLVLSVAIQGLGAAAFVTNMVTNVLENRSNSSARDRASRLVALSATPEAEAGGGVSFSPVETMDEVAQRCYKILKNIRELHAYKTAQINSGFMARVRNFVTTHCVSFLRAAGVQTAVGQGSALAMTRGARMLSTAQSGFLFMQDLMSVLRDMQHQEEGARMQVAAELQTHVKELEEQLSQLSRL